MKTKVIRDNGVLKIDIGGKIYDPLSFKSFRANPKNVSEFYKAGVRLFSVLSSGVTSALGVPYSLYGESWVGEGKYDFSAIDRQMDMFIENAPEAYFAPMFQVDTREWYLASHDVPNSFTHLSQIACDEQWKKAAADYIKAAIAYCEEKYGERIYGYFLLGGMTTEWFSGRDYEESHPIKEAGYRKWRNDENAKLPAKDLLDAEGEVFLGEHESEVYLARKFHNETIADLILYFCHEAQSVIKHNKLLGLYYGYLFELGGARLFNDGSLGYEKVFLSHDIDMISSPSAYGYRGLNDPSAYMLTHKTLDAHNKLYFLEFDHITHTAPEMVNDPEGATQKNKALVKIPGANSKCKNETESLNLMYRDFILCNSNMTALWWFDMFDGWFRSDGMMQAVAKMIKLSKEFGETNTHRVSEIAVFAEGEAMYRVRKTSNMATLCLSNIRRTLAECGAPYDLYSIGDVFLPQVKDYKLYIFVNQYDMPEMVKKYITEQLKIKGKTVLWLYAPDYAKNGERDVFRVSQTVGMTVKTSEQSHGDVVFDGDRFSYPVSAPYFSVDDDSAHVLCRFEDGSVAAAYKETDGVKTVYVATCNLPSELLRTIAKLANVFVYSENNKVYVYPNSQVVGVYNATESDAEIH
ncbi:MAG: hypothetical protein II334_03465, partial [Clostridia bacterium]|nr:hypothetical protein [Clostridia bacterium]